MILARPHGLAEVRATFGDERPFRQSDGHLGPTWEGHTLASVVLPHAIPLGWDTTHPITRIRCHHLLVPILDGVFAEMTRHDLWKHWHTFDGCYADRAIRGAATPSMHSWGIALDLNAATNALGTVGDMHPNLIAVFEQAGFFWGGRFEHRKDPQHFQMAENV